MILTDRKRLTAFITPLLHITIHNPLNLLRPRHKILSGIINLRRRMPQQIRIKIRLNIMHMLVNPINIIEKQLTASLRITNQTIFKQNSLHIRKLSNLMVLLIQLIIGNHNYPLRN